LATTNLPISFLSISFSPETYEEPLFSIDHRRTRIPDSKTYFRVDFSKPSLTLDVRAQEIIDFSDFRKNRPGLLT
jgi:hypothetical protein